jgi:hypothetical protein
MRNEAAQSLRETGFARLDATGIIRHAKTSRDALSALEGSWDRLPRDPHLKDGGRYRARRHSCYIQDRNASSLAQVPHRAHWQSTAYNALHGGMLRWFEPIEEVVASAPAWHQLLVCFGDWFATVRPAPRWFIEAHQFRIDTAGGVGRPTPEGAHRDGVDFVAILLIARRNVTGGETRVFEANGPNGVRFTLEEPWSALLLDDTRVIHETTPIQPVAANRLGQRDTLVITYRAQGFQEP